MSLRIDLARKVAAGVAFAGLATIAFDLAPAAAKPPSWAPAHGYRAKHEDRDWDKHHDHDRDKHHDRDWDRNDSRYRDSRYRDGRYTSDRYRSTRYYGTTRVYGSRPGDLDGDGIRNGRDNDRDGDGVRNSRDHHPDDRRRR